MWPAFLETLPLAFGVAISPIPIAAIILVLMSRNGFSKSVAFVWGWFIGIILLVGLVILFILDMEQKGRMEGSVIMPVIKISFGVLLLVMSWRSWQRRPRRGEIPGHPGWMDSLDRFGNGKSMVLGALLGTLNLKNLPITISAAGSFAGHHLPVNALIPALAGFALIGSIGVLVPVLVARGAGERARKVLHDWKEWLSLHNAVIMFGLFLVIGLAVLSKGLTDLL